MKQNHILPIALCIGAMSVVSPALAQSDNVKLEINAIGGHIVGDDFSGVPTTVTKGKPIYLMPVAPAEGYQLKGVKVRHGQNIKGGQYVDGVKQWDEYDVTDAEADETFTIDGKNVDGDVMVTAVFEPDGTEEYKLVFADEFNGEDGSMPNEANWSRCSREHPTWKRFTAQTKEGQERTAYIKDGNLVTRCIANDIDEEGDVDMISGAVESAGKMNFTYGRIEGRLRTTPHTGNFPAFWMMPQDGSAGWPTCGEIDLWEQIDADGRTYHTVHTHVTYDLNQAKPNSGGIYTNAADYHVIAMEWEPELLSWFVDGVKVFSYAKSKNADLLSKGQWPFDKPFYLILNQSVGDGSWARPCDVSFTYETFFDYVRLYQKDGQSATLPPSTAIGNVNTDNLRNVDAFATDGGIRIVTPEDRLVTINDIAGRTAFRGMVQGNKDIRLDKGMYVVEGKKIMVK